MERTVRRGEPQTYAQAVASLWERVGVTLVRLEHIADSPPEVDADDLLDELPSLQYSLHSGAELALVATLLVIGGAFLFTAGAVLAAWPVWAAGLALFAGGFVLYRP